MTFLLFLVIVTSFAMSFALPSASMARLILDAPLLHCTRERPTLLNFAFAATYRLLNEVSSLLVAVHSLSAECGSVFADLALYLAVCGLASVELSCSLSLSCFKARPAPIPRLHILAVWSFSRSLSLSLSSSFVVGSRSATSYLATALLSARGLHHCIRRLSCCLLEVGLRYFLDLTASHRLGHLCLPLHLWSHCSFLRDFDLFLKLFYIT